MTPHHRWQSPCCSGLVRSCALWGCGCPTILTHTLPVSEFWLWFAPASYSVCAHLTSRSRCRRWFAISGCERASSAGIPPHLHGVPCRRSARFLCKFPQIGSPQFRTFQSLAKDKWFPTLFVEIKLHFPTIVRHLDSCEKLKTANKLCIHSILLIVSGIWNRICWFFQPSPVATWLIVCLPDWQKMMNDGCFSSPSHAAYRGDEKWKSSPPEH